MTLSRTGRDDTPPSLGVDEGIMLNGAPDDDFEPFHLDSDGGSMEFCKTARRPYDVVVTAILLRASQVAKQAFSVGELDGIISQVIECRK